MKKLVIALFAMLIVTPAWAQLDEMDFSDMSNGATIDGGKKHSVMVGPKVGVTLNSMTQPEEVSLYDEMGIGASGGVALKSRFSRLNEYSGPGTGYFGVSVELKYKINSVKTKGADEKGKENANLSLGYVDVPITAQVYPFAKLSNVRNLYFEVGASLGLLVSRSPKSLTVSGSSDKYSKVEYFIDSNGSKLKGGSVSPIVGVGYTVPGTQLDINARYYIGMSKLAKNFPCKMSCAEISLAWMFNVGSF